MTDGKGIPVSAFTTSAQVAEVNTIETLVDVTILDKRPDRLLYDKAADANWLRDALDVRGIEQITPHRRSRKKQSAAGRTLPPTVQASMEGRANIQLARQLPTHSGSTRNTMLISSKASSTGHACYYVSSSFETASKITGRWRLAYEKQRAGRPPLRCIFLLSADVIARSATNLMNRFPPQPAFGYSNPVARDQHLVSATCLQTESAALCRPT